MDMSCSLLLAIMLGYIQPTTPPSQAPAFIAADIARLSELLNLEKSQSESLRMLLMDHESDWLKTQARVINDLHETPAWAHAIAAESTWRAARSQSIAANRNLKQAQLQSLKDTVDAPDLNQLKLAASAAQRKTATTRVAMFEARREADPGRALLFAQLALAQNELIHNLDIDCSIESMLDDEQRALWPMARRTVRRARRLRSLGLPGADTNLEGRVLRATGVPNESLQQAINAWAHKTDALLDRIDTLELEARTAQDDVIAAAVFQEADQLQAELADNTLRAAATMQPMDDTLASLHQELRAEAFPLTWGPTDLHRLAKAAKDADDPALLLLARMAIVNYTASINDRAQEWQSIERARRLARLMRGRGLDADALDPDALQRAGDDQRAIRIERDALVRAQVRVLLQSTKREHVLRVQPGMPLPLR